MLYNTSYTQIEKKVTAQGVPSGLKKTTEFPVFPVRFSASLKFFFQEKVYYP